MASSLVLIFALFLAAAQSAPERIVGGTTTVIENYPSIVQVEFRTGILWGQSCAANILNTRYVLSAAHCFSGLFFSIRNRRIRAGTTNRNNGGTTISVDAVFNHPTWGSLDNDGDITVVRLSSALVYSDRIQQVAIVNQGWEAPDNSPVVHAGWGTISSGGLASALLRHVEINTINRALCRARYAPRPRSSITDNMICAGVLDVGGRDACQGDSGGPLYFQGILIGVVSWGRGCADAFYPGVSAAVSPYTNWILATAV
uniref:Trypsin-like serine proteinase T22 n=1 Tax=Ostrinia nubilalis TaxID=29057 RepID=B6D1Q8_OSTNU|nr:trypsin-like serine proteinase T22 [Ostrinia nubilalis]